MSTLPRSLMIQESSLKIKTALIASGLVATILASSSAYAVSATTSTLTYQQVVAPFESSGSQTTLLNLMQFDPALGTLVGVQFRTAISSYEISVSLDQDSLAGWLDFGHSFVSASLSGGQYSVGKLAGTAGLLFATRGGPFGSISNATEVLTGGSPTMVATSEDATGRLQNDNVFNDFIGTGTVAGLSWAYYQFAFGPNVILTDGIADFEVEIGQITSQSVGQTTVFVDYIYQAAVVPEPEAWGLMLAGLALIGAAARRRSR